MSDIAYPIAFLMRTGQQAKAHPGVVRRSTPGGVILSRKLYDETLYMLNINHPHLLATEAEHSFYLLETHLSKTLVCAFTDGRTYRGVIVPPVLRGHEKGNRFFVGCSFIGKITTDPVPAIDADFGYGAGTFRHRVSSDQPVDIDHVDPGAGMGDDTIGDDPIT